MVFEEIVPKWRIRLLPNRATSGQVLREQGEPRTRQQYLNGLELPAVDAGEVGGGQ